MDQLGALFLNMNTSAPIAFLSCTSPPAGSSSSGTSSSYTANNSSYTTSNNNSNNSNNSNNNTNQMNHAHAPSGVISYVAPADKTSALASACLPVQASARAGNCNICHAGLATQPSAQLKGCGHAFHLNCVKSPLTCSPKCPTCSRPILEASGESPSGSMSISTLSRCCPGFANSSQTIEITYSIPGGTQKDYNANPGVAYRGTSRTAFLPNNQEGRDLLQRLQVSWKAGLIFKIGMSQTSGRNNVVVWGAIPHKTTLNGGAFGFPDSNYMGSCNTILDSLAVPDAQACAQMLAGGVAGVVSAPPSAPFAPTAPTAPTAPVLQASASVAPRATRATTAAAAVAVASAPTASTKDHTVHQETLHYDAPESLSEGNAVSKALQSRPTKKSKRSDSDDEGKKKPAANSNEDDEDCVICLCALSEAPQMFITSCNHTFHQDCIQQCLDKEPRCPICRSAVGEPQGKGPSGTMSIQVIGSKCSGFRSAKGTIQIDYVMPSGTQKSFHENAGVGYHGTSRRAYLPHNEEGKQLLTRLKYAWMHGLSFRVGTSLTTGQENSITWTSVHHKTSMSAGPHGYPDPVYFDNCNESLDALGVPDADGCLEA